MTDFAQSRRKMVDNQLRTNDVTDHRILDAM
ncbi:MAG: protein-L-isoaspartate O-methyltransferase, partial [Roseibium polysiphoniae]